jgi:hypothetical protein
VLWTLPLNAGPYRPFKDDLKIEFSHKLLRNDILVDDSTRVVRYNSLGSSKSPRCDYRPPTQVRAVCEEAAAVFALSGKMIHGTVRFCARGANHKWT